MNRSRTAIRRIWVYANASEFNAMLLTKGVAQSNPTKQVPVLVVPDNPVARIAMIERTLHTLWPDMTALQCIAQRELIETILATTLTP